VWHARGRRGIHVGIRRESQKEREHWEDTDIGGMIMLKWIIEKDDGMIWTGLLWLRTGTREGFYEHGIKPSCSMNN
jgi:hypothetical protein